MDKENAPPSGNKPEEQSTSSAAAAAAASEPTKNAPASEPAPAAEPAGQVAAEDEEEESDWEDLDGMCEVLDFAKSSIFLIEMLTMYVNYRGTG